MTDHSLAQTVSRRNVLKRGAIASGALVLGTPVFTGVGRASFHNVNLEVHATINRNQRGVVPVTITAMDPNTTIEQLLAAEGVAVGDLRFGPRRSDVPEMGTEPRSYSLVRRGTVLKVRFESGAGSDTNNWWDDATYADRDSAAVASTSPNRADIFGEDTDIKVVGKK